MSSWLGPKPTEECDISPECYDKTHGQTQAVAALEQTDAHAAMWRELCIKRYGRS